jgi:hypothetical protein
MPDIVDVKGFRIETPILMPLEADALEARQEAFDKDNLALLKAVPSYQSHRSESRKCLGLDDLRGAKALF